MKKLLNCYGFTMIEVILSITILSIVIVPLMNMFVLSAKITQESSYEYKSFLEAQKYIEEIKAMESIDYAKYSYNLLCDMYECTVIQTEDTLGATVKIIPQGDFLYLIEVNIIDEGKVVNSLLGSKVFN